MVDHKKIAQELYDAELSNVPIEQLTSRYENLRIDDAYKIQIINIEKKIAEGRKITGKKIGLTSKAMQESLGVDTPDFGFLYDSMEVSDQKIPRGAILQPRVEGELAFILKKDLGDARTVEEVLEATEYIVPAIEIVGSRIADWKLTIVDTIADNASCGMYLLSDCKIDPNITDLKEIEMKLYKNNQLINSGFGSAVLGNPANAVLWLAKSLSEYGVSLNSGDIILAGALSAAIPATGGDSFTCDFGEFGKIKVDFE